MSQDMLKVGFVYGWRIFKVIETGTPVLRSPHRSDVKWEFNEVKTAYCSAAAYSFFMYSGTLSTHTDSPAPDEDCTCGFYNYWQPDGLAHYGEYRASSPWVMRYQTHCGTRQARKEDDPRMSTLDLSEIQKNPRAFLRAYYTYHPWQHNRNRFGVPYITLVTLTKNWGKIVPYQHGFRSQYCSIAALFPDLSDEFEGEFARTHQEQFAQHGVSILDLADVVSKKVEFSSEIVEMPASEVL